MSDEEIMNKGLKAPKTKSIFDGVTSKKEIKENFEKTAREKNESMNQRAQDFAKLVIMYNELLKSKEVADQDSQLEREKFLNILRTFISYAEDQNESEEAKMCEGSMGLITLLFQSVNLLKKDRNIILFELDKVKKELDIVKKDLNKIIQETNSVTKKLQ